MPSITKLVVGMVTMCAIGLAGCGTDAVDPGDPEAAGGGLGEEVSELSAATALTCNTNLVPTMTSATSPSGVVSRSGVYDASFEAWQAFDSSNTTMWISEVFQTPAWIAYQWGSGARTVTSYAINFVNGSLTSRAPRDWTFEGWNGSSWNVIDTRSAQTGWLGVEHRAYTVASPGSYSRYRLNMSDDNDSRAGVVVVSMGRLELIGCPPSTCGDGVCSTVESSLSCPTDCDGGGGGGACLIAPCP
jgi:hypothetical protein